MVNVDDFLTVDLTSKPHVPCYFERPFILNRIISETFQLKSHTVECCEWNNGEKFSNNLLKLFS